MKRAQYVKMYVFELLLKKDPPFLKQVGGGVRGDGESVAGHCDAICAGWSPVRPAEMDTLNLF